MTLTAPEAPIDIANIALHHLGQTSVVNIDTPSSAHEHLLSEHYDKVRQECLREYIWNFAKRRISLSRTGTPICDYTDSYALPNDFIRFLSWGGAEGEMGFGELNFSMDYDLSDGALLCNNNGNSSCFLRYIYDCRTVIKFDALFINIFSLRLALDIAFKVTVKNTVVERLNKQLTIAEAKAISVDGQERPPRRFQTSRFINARTNLTTRSGVAGKWTRFER